jgi:hypothetical protein
MVGISPIVIGKTLLLPRIQFWPKNGWRCEIVIDDKALGDVEIGPWFETREGAEKWSERAMLKTAERYAA